MFFKKLIAAAAGVAMIVSTVPASAAAAFNGSVVKQTVSGHAEAQRNQTSQYGEYVDVDFREKHRFRGAGFRNQRVHRGHRKFHGHRGYRHHRGIRRHHAYRKHGYRKHGYRKYGHYRHHRHYRRNHGAGIALGILGLTTGAIIASEAYKHNSRRHYRYHSGGLEPFTAAWYAACARKYRSFNPQTGRYLSYSGQYRLCRI